MQKIWLVEFLTEDEDYDFVAFEEAPSDEQIQNYIGGVDWLLEELKDETLTWVVSPIDFISNRN